MACVLVVDDEKNIREGLALAFESEGYETKTAEDGEIAWEMINKTLIDLVVTDLRMPKLSGHDLLKKIYSTYPNIPVIVLTGHGSIEDAVMAMREGAADFFTKPIDIDHLLMVAQKSINHSNILKENKKLNEEILKLKNESKFAKIIGKSPKLVKLTETIAQVAPSNASVLINGESGVGKELVADAIHNLSNRADKPFVVVHCASLSSSLLESELFGHEKGAFTGAIATTKGKFEVADGGTLFLDEIGEIDMATQVKLLRAIQERTFERVGGNKPIKVDVRIVSATNRNLIEEVKNGNFREDLFYRLNVVSIEVPPLRDRKDDIGLLMTDFLKTFNKENNKKIEGFSPSAKKTLYAYNWPGNIRELKNAIEAAVVMAKTNIIEIEDLPSHITDSASESYMTISVGSSLAEAEKELILGTLAACKGNKTRAAEVLQIGRKTLHRKLQEYNFED